MFMQNRLLRTLNLALFLFFSSVVYGDATSTRLQELQHLLKHDCGSCHGMTLKGGLGPSLLADSLAGKPDEFLFITIKEGRPGTPMPPWKSLLSDKDISLIIELLRKGNN